MLLRIGLGSVLEPSGDVATIRRIVAILVPGVLGGLFPKVLGGRFPEVDAHDCRHRRALDNLFALGVFLA